MDGPETIVTALPVQLVDLPDGTLIRRGATQVHIAGSGMRIVLDLIFALAGSEGTSKAEIRDLVLPRFPDLTAAALDTLFDNLLSSRLLQPLNKTGPAAGSTDDPLIQIFRWDCGIADGRALSESHIVILGVNQIAASLTSALASCGIGRISVIDDPLLRSARLSDENGELDLTAWGRSAPVEDTAAVLDSKIDLLLAASEAGNQQAFRSWNQLAIDREIPFLPVLLTDQIGQIGPLVQPGAGPCLECLRARQNANLDHAERLRAAEETSHLHQDAIGFLPPMAQVLGGIAAIEAVKYWVNPRQFDSVGHMLEINLLESVTVRRKVLKIPRCRVCAGTGKRAASRLSKTLPIAEMS